MNDKTKGAVIVALSAFFFGTYGLWSRLIGSQIDNLFQVYVRSLLILIVIIPVAIATKSLKKVNKKDWKWIAVYTLSGALTVAPIFYSFNKIGIGSSTLLFYASFTIISFILGYLSFGEKITLTKIVSLIAALIGLSLIFELQLQQNFLLPALMAILAGSAAGIEVVFTKKVSNKYSALQLSIFTWAVIFFLHLFGSILIGERQLLPQISVAWLGVVGYAFASLAAFFFVITGYKYVEPAVGALTGLLEIVVGILLGLIFFAEPLTMQIIIGGLMILLAAALPTVVPMIAKKNLSTKN